MMGVRRIAAVLLVLVLAAPAIVAAQDTPSLVLAPTSGPAGQVVATTGSGFQAGTVEIFLDTVVARDQLATQPIDRSGGFEVAVTIASNTTQGPHRLIACRDRTDTTCREQATATFTVNPPPTTTSTTTTTGSIATTTVTPTVTTSLPGDVGVVTTTTIAPGPDDVAGLPTSVGPDPTFNPDPDDLAIESTTTTLGFQIDAPADGFEDLRVRAIEVTQGIQNLPSSMPLVADRRTYVRVHPETVDGDDWAPIDGLLQLQRNGLPDLVLVPENGPIAVNVDRTSWNAALNYLLPSEYLAPGTLTISTVVWAFNSSTLDDQEPNPADNFDQITVELIEGDNPAVVMVALDDGAGPGPVIDDTSVLLDFALVIALDLLQFHPVSGLSFSMFPNVLGPGPEALEPGQWDLAESDGDESRRAEPNIRTFLVAAANDLFDVGNVMGRFDPSIPADGYSGWATDGVSWNKPQAGTPAHELGHTRGLQHVGCKDSDGDGIGDESAGGAVDPKHPTGLPPVCSLAPIGTAGYFGMTTYVDPIQIYSNDPTHAQAAFPLMSYKGPGWTDPYHWCLLLEAYGVPCSPGAVGVPPKVLVNVDCDPEPIGAGGFQLDLCLIDQLPPPGDPGPGPPPGDGGQGNQSSTTTTVFPGPFVHPGPVVLGDNITISGWVNLNQRTGTLGQSFVRDEVSKFAQARLNGVIERAVANGYAPVYAQLSGPAGEVLLTLPIEVDGAGHGGGKPAGPVSGFVQTIPFADGTSSVDLLLDGIVVSTIEVSNGRPQIGAVEVETLDASTVISWEASDPDGDPLTAMVSWSNDGELWLPVTDGIRDGEVVVPASAPFPGGDEVRVRVEVHDGVWTARAESTRFTVPGHAAMMAIAGIEPDVRVERFDPIQLFAVVIDNDGNLVRDDIEWTSDLDGQLGAGGSMATRDLRLGVHTVTASTVDDGQSVTASISFEIVERTTPTRYTETPDPSAVELLTGTPGAENAGSATAAPDNGSDDSGVSTVLLVVIGVLIAGLGAGLARRRADSSALGNG